MRNDVSFSDKETWSTAEATLVTDYCPEVKGEVYFFNRLVTRNPGKGGGTKVLNQLLAYIDSVGVPLLNQVSAYGNLSQKDLEAYYKRHGFTRVSDTYGDELLIYYPKNYVKEETGMKELKTNLEKIIELLGRKVD